MATQLTARDQLDITAIKLNAVYFQKYNEFDNQPGIATVTSPIFKTIRTNLAAYYQETFAGVGYFRKTSETDSNVYDRTIVRNNLTTLLDEYTLNELMSKEYFETSNELHPVLTNTMTNLTSSAMKSQNLTGFGLFRGGFTQTLTADGQP